MLSWNTNNNPLKKKFNTLNSKKLKKEEILIINLKA